MEIQSRAKTLILTGLLVFINLSLIAQDPEPADTEIWEPVPDIVTPGEAGKAPSDAIILFNGTNLDEWIKSDSTAIKWINKDSILTAFKGSIYSKRKFGDCQLHIEWRTPAEISGEGQGRGNSGIYFQSRYEVQILDSYDNPTYVNGQAGSIYKQYAPLVNASNKPGEWQVYDIIFTAPVFDDLGEKIKSGRFSVLHNGILIQNNVEILGTTEYIGPPKNEAHGKAPLMLQDHGNPVSFRNIWIREL